MVDEAKVKYICDIYDWDGKGELDLFFLGDVMYALGMNTTKKVGQQLTLFPGFFIIKHGISNQKKILVSSYIKRLFTSFNILYTQTKIFKSILIH